MNPRSLLSRLLKSRRSGEREGSHTSSFAVRIKNMVNAGFFPKCIIDCGASVGHWSHEVSRIFPGSQIVAIEPNSRVLPQTRKTLSSVEPKVIIEECALGARAGDAYLNIWDNEQTSMSGSSLKAHVQGEPREKMKVRMESLDNIADTHGLQPDFVKLDLQGGELEALEGAVKVLQVCEVVVVEFGCLEAYIGRTTPLDLMERMYGSDYCLYDIVDLIYRPYDNALTGGDFIFVKTRSQLKKYSGYI